MKSLLLASALVVGMSGMAYADMPGADWMNKDQITNKLTDMGYTNIRKLEADDGHWEGDATKGSTEYEIHVDPHTGELTKNEPKH